jgi:dolichol-phosphate hexosyltransferase
MYKNVTISVVIPCLNEEKGIAETLRRIPDYVDEVVVVDNGSVDQTGNVARSCGAVVVVQPKRGYGIAKRTGFQAATRDVIVTADGDGTYPLEAIPQLIDCMLETGVGFVCGCRFPLQNPNAMAFRNFFGNQAISLAMTWIFREKFCDGLSGMYCLRRENLSNFRLISDGWNLSEEIKLEAALHPDIGYRECHILYRERVGISKLTPWKTGIENLLFLFRKRFFLPKPGSR